MAYSPRSDYDERTPLLQNDRFTERPRSYPPPPPRDPHAQFCMLIGMASSDKTQGRDEAETVRSAAARGTLYSRALKKRRSQARTYAFTAALSNTLLLSQIVLGATLTALGASESSHILITLFGVLNTVIAGAIAFIKSRGQPMRARSFRDDLEHVVDEIENSEIMWLGITKDIHGYDEIDIDDKVSVRSEVARLTRLYESAVKKNAQNNPDMYSAGGVLDAITGLRARPSGSGGAGIQLPPVVQAGPSGAAAAPGGDATAAAGGAADADESPATSKDAGKKDNGKDKEASPAPAPAPASASAPAPVTDSAPAAAAADSTPAPESADTATAAPSAAAAPAAAPSAPAQDKEDDPDAEPASAVHPPTKDSDKTAAKGANGA